MNVDAFVLEETPWRDRATIERHVEQGLAVVTKRCRERKRSELDKLWETCAFSGGLQTFENRANVEFTTEAIAICVALHYMKYEKLNNVSVQLRSMHGQVIDPFVKVANRSQQRVTHLGEDLRLQSHSGKGLGSP